MEGVFFKDVRPGDVVCETEGQLGEVLRVHHDHELGPPRIVLMCKHGMLFRGRPDQVIGRTYHPWSDGKTESQMADEVLMCARVLVETFGGRGYAELRDAIMAYARGRHPRNESLVDRHMTP